MSEWKQVGTVTILRERIYPIDPFAEELSSILATTVVVPPGVYPVYRKFDAYRWVMRGHINERHAKIGDGLYELNSGDRPTGLEVQFPSGVYGAEAFAELLAAEVAQPGPAQRLAFEMSE